LSLEPLKAILSDGPAKRLSECRSAKSNIDSIDSYTISTSLLIIDEISASYFQLHAVQES